MSEMFQENIKIKDLKLEMGRFVKSLRKKENVSQDDLAQLLDLSRITIQNLESGKNFTIDTLLKILQHFELLGALNQLLGQQINDNQNLDSLY